MRTRLTDGIIAKLPLPAKGTARVWDAPDPNNPRKPFLSGYGVRLSSGGKRSLILYYRTKGPSRAERLLTIGEWPTWSVEAGRSEALDLKRRIARDHADPVKERRDGANAPDMAKLCDRFLAEYVPAKRPSTQREYRSLIELYIRPALGRKLVAGVDADDIVRLHGKVSERSKYQANRVVGVCSRMFVLAIRWRWRETNPAVGIEHNPETKRKRYLTPDELKRLTDALAGYENQGVANLFRLLLLTGARAGETMSARWSQFDFHRNVWIKPGSATKQRREHETPLSDQVLNLLRSMRKDAPDDAVFLFPGHGPRGHRSMLGRAWNRICKAAGIPRSGPQALRIHDLRHSYASFMVSAGFSLPVVGAMLGHSQPMTTARYAHLLDDPLREAANKVGALMSGLTAKPSKRKGLKLVRGGKR
jgi:integrase